MSSDIFLLKSPLIEVCKTILQERMDHAKAAMEAAQESANGEEKSSAGDKYETSRAMGHRDRDMYAQQLAEAQREMVKLSAINTTLRYSKVQTGAVVSCGDNIYFIASGIGKVEVSEKTVMVISPLSPIAKLLTGKSKGDTFTFNGTEKKIEAIA